MTALVQDSIDVVHEFAAAVLYVADVERPGLTLWDALAEALQMWIGGAARVGEHANDRASESDQLRTVLELLLATAAGVGLPGGASIASIIDAAMTTWSESAAVRLNQGTRFGAANRTPSR